MEIGVGPARYRDLNSDLPVCITQDFLLIQTVTGLWNSQDKASVKLGSGDHPQRWHQLSQQIMTLVTEREAENSKNRRG